MYKTVERVICALTNWLQGRKPSLEKLDDYVGLKV